MKYIYSTSQMLKLSLTLCTFSVTGSVASLFLIPDIRDSKHCPLIQDIYKADLVCSL